MNARGIQNAPEFAELVDLIVGGKLSVGEYAGLIVSDREVKQPGQTLPDELRSTLRDAKLESDYRIICRETDTPGIWYAGVVRNGALQ
jgi:hypothetical protein